MSVKMFIVIREAKSAPSAPTDESGSESMMVNGWMNDSNCAARMR